MSAYAAASSLMRYVFLALLAYFIAVLIVRCNSSFLLFAFLAGPARGKGEYRFSTKQKRYCEINGQPLIRRETPLADGDVVWVQDVCFVCHKMRAEEGDHA